MPRPRVNTGKWTINELYEDYYKQNKLIFNTEYQRSEVWNLKKKQRLIDSIIKEYNFGMIFLRKLPDGEYEVLDGQQRLKTIFQFIENEYSISEVFTPEVGGEPTFTELKEDSGRFARFIAFQLDLAFVENADDETTADIFLRLQEGMPLNTAEKLNAMRGKMRNLILNLSNHDVIKATSIKDRRFAHRLLAAQIFKLEMDSNFDNQNFPDIKYEELKDMYERYISRDPPSTVITTIKKVLNFLMRSLDDSTGIIKRRGDFIPIYLLSSFLQNKYVTIDIEGSFNHFIMNFLNKVENVNTRDESLPQEDEPFRDYKMWRSTGALSSQSFKERFRIILSKFLEYKDDLQPKDSQRLFDEGQKLAIYYREKGICQICNNQVKFKEAEFHHITHWSRGGLTIVNNGQFLCQNCHQNQRIHESA